MPQLQAVAHLAGAVITASVFYKAGPYFSWAVAVIAGGGSAAAGKAAGTAVHTGSTVTSGGAANPVVSLLETVWSWFQGILSVAAPLPVILFLLLLIALIFKISGMAKRKKPEGFDCSRLPEPLYLP